MGQVWAFTVHLMNGKWFSLFAAVLIISVVGTPLVFGTYSNAIKTTLGYDQQTLNLLSFFKDLGGLVGVFTGLIAEVTPTWFVLLTGSAMNFSGYFMIWLAVTGKIHKPEIWQMCLCISIGSNALNFANTGSVVPCVVNFPQNRGAILGLLKGVLGLSGAIVTQIYLAIYGNDPKSLILVIAWLPAAISMVFAFTMRVVNLERQANEHKALYHFLYISIVLALFLLASTLLQKQFDFSHGAYVACAIMVLIVLLTPLLIVIRREMIIWNHKKHMEATEPSSEVVEQIPKELNDPKEEKAETSCFCTIFDKPERGEDYTILQALLSIDMLLLFVISFCGMGASLTAADNLGQIGESLGYPTKTITTFVSLASIWNYFGRVFAGFVSETLITKYKTPRPLMMTFFVSLSAVGHIIVAFPFPNSVYLASMIMGLCNGAQFPLLLAIISELFGLKYYSMLFNCGQLASPAGLYVLNVKVTGVLYDKEALKQLRAKGLDRSSVKGLVCIGVECFRKPFIVLASVATFGGFVSLILVMRTRKFYSGDIYKKFRRDDDAMVQD